MKNFLTQVKIDNILNELAVKRSGQDVYTRRAAPKPRSWSASRGFFKPSTTTSPTVSRGSQNPVQMGSPTPKVGARKPQDPVGSTAASRISADKAAQYKAAGVQDPTGLTPAQKRAGQIPQGPGVAGTGLSLNLPLNRVGGRGYSSPGRDLPGSDQSAVTRGPGIAGDVKGSAADKSSTMDISVAQSVKDAADTRRKTAQNVKDAADTQTRMSQVDKFDPAMQRQKQLDQVSARMRDRARNKAAQTTPGGLGNPPRDDGTTDDTGRSLLGTGILPQTPQRPAHGPPFPRSGETPRGQTQLDQVLGQRQKAIRDKAATQTRMAQVDKFDPTKQRQTQLGKVADRMKARELAKSTDSPTVGAEEDLRTKAIAQQKAAIAKTILPATAGARPTTTGPPRSRTSLTTQPYRSSLGQPYGGIGPRTSSTSTGERLLKDPNMKIPGMKGIPKVPQAPSRPPPDRGFPYRPAHGGGTGPYTTEHPYMSRPAPLRPSIGMKGGAEAYGANAEPLGSMFDRVTAYRDAKKKADAKIRATAAALPGGPDERDANKKAISRHIGPGGGVSQSDKDRLMRAGRRQQKVRDRFDADKAVKTDWDNPRKPSAEASRQFRMRRRSVGDFSNRNKTDYPAGYFGDDD